VIAGPTPGLIEALGDAAWFIDPYDHECMGRRCPSRDAVDVEAVADGCRRRDVNAPPNSKRITDDDLDVFDVVGPALRRDGP
jgi:hypothetical protein